MINTEERDILLDNPRECHDNISRMICFHSKYILGDKHQYRQGDFTSWEELKLKIMSDYNVMAIEPLYLYDHGGITISTKPFSCRWDSGQVGFVFVENMKLQGENTEDIIKREVEQYDNYLLGY
jgi:hypothetical protein